MKKKMKRIKLILLALVLLMSYYFSVGTQTTPAATNLGPYVIKSALNSNMCVDVYGAVFGNGTNINLYTANSSTAQFFYLQYEGNSYYSIRSYADQRFAFDISGGKAYDGANVILYKYHGGANQLWKIINTGKSCEYYIKSKSGDYYLDVSGGKAADKTNIQVYSGNKTKAQRWYFVKAYNVKAAVNYALTYSDDSATYRSIYNKAYNRYTPYSITYHGYDCTNFVSQCLYQAGIRETNQWRRVKAGEKVSASKGQVAFVNCSSLFNYLVNTLHYKKELVTDLSKIRVGDLVFMDTTGDNVVNHATICTKASGSARYMTSHSKWRKNFAYAKNLFKKAYIVRMPS